jgi:hypothetical protein
MSRRRRNANPRAVLLWAVLGFIGVQVALDVGVVARHTEMDDPEYGRRLAILRERIAEEPGRPLLLMLGSSRTEVNFRPERLPTLQTASGEQALPFNFSHLGAGPGMNLVELRRLLRDGIRPAWLVVEVMPPWLGDDRQSALIRTTNVNDLSVTRRYRDPLQVYGYFLRGQLVPCYKHRQFLAHQAIPGWVPPAEWEKNLDPPLGPLGGDYSLKAVYDPEECRCRTESARATFLPVLQDLHVVDLSDRALHELLDLCRRRHISVALLLTPEGKAFQSWYSPQSRDRVDCYCAALAREYGVPLVDARDWLDDADFFDSHHTTAPGAEAFTQKLGREVLQPLVEGNLAPVSPR